MVMALNRGFLTDMARFYLAAADVV